MRAEGSFFVVVVLLLPFLLFKTCTHQGSTGGPATKILACVSSLASQAPSLLLEEAQTCANTVYRQNAGLCDICGPSKILPEDSPAPSYSSAWFSSDPHPSLPFSLAPNTLRRSSVSDWSPDSSIPQFPLRCTQPTDSLLNPSYPSCLSL